MNEHREPIPSMIYNAAVGGHVANSQQIIDENENKEQSQINSEVKKILGAGSSVDERIAEEGAKHYLKEETYNKSELNNIITTPNQKYVSVTATAETTAITDILPATGSADTIYRVGNWDGTQYNDSVFSEYAWNGNTYIKLSTKSQIGEVYDISANNANTKYVDLVDALGTNGDNIPPTLRKGGMSIKFIKSFGNKYVQYSLMSDTFSTNKNDWQGVDDEPTAGSKNLVESGGVAVGLIKLNIAQEHNTPLISRNLYDKSKVTMDCYVNASDGKIYSLANFGATDFIPIKPSTNYTFHNYSYSQIDQMAFYDENLVYISGNVGGSTVPMTIQSPSDAKYMRVSSIWGLYVDYMISEGTDDLPYTEYKQFIPKGYIESESPILVGTGQKFTTILAALKNTNSSRPIKVLAGTYNIANEYKELYGADFWDNYAGYAESADKFMRGLWLGDGRRISFDAAAKVVYDVNTQNSNVWNYFSSFATCGNCEISGLQLDFNSQCRYAVHDDYVEVNGVTKYINCIFNGQSGNGDTIGGGLGASSTIIFENCIFLGNQTDQADISYHNTGYNHGKSLIIISNCYGQNNVKFKWFGTSNEITRCIVNNCNFNSISCAAHTVEPNNIENMELITWNNTTNT